MDHYLTGEPLPLAISYYQLYTEIIDGAAVAAVTENQDDGCCMIGVNLDSYEPQQHEQQQQLQHELTVSQSSYEPWVVDTEWDATREAAAEQELLDNVERCRLPPSSNWSEDRSSCSNRNHGKAATAVAWNQFYQHHQTSFFKDRHWPAIAFPNEFSAVCCGIGVLVEVGCGVGNTLLPLLETKKASGNASRCWTVYGMDVSVTAIELLQRDTRYLKAHTEKRAFAAVVDIAQPNSIPPQFVGVATVTSLLFCLSAIDPMHHTTAVENTLSSLQPGGILVFRDYGRYDEAQMKLGRQRHKLIRDGFYRKHDGTCCYYFTTEHIRQLIMTTTNFEMEELECHYIRRVYTNRSDQTQRRRVWVQARFRKIA